MTTNESQLTRTLSTVQQVLFVLGAVTDPNSIPANTLTKANALYPGCVALIDQHAPTAPDSIKNLALIRLFGWMWQNDMVTWDPTDPLRASGALQLLDGYSAPSGDSASGYINALKAISSLPPASDYSVGDIVNQKGVQYELVKSTEDSNVLRGTVASLSGNFYGTADFQWESVSPYNIRVKLSKSALGTSPPAMLYPKVTATNGLSSDLSLSRASGQDSETQYAYVHTPGSAGLGSVPVGQTFAVAFYSDTGYSTPFTIHNANRWERDDRNQPSIVTAMQTAFGAVKLHYALHPPPAASYNGGTMAKIHSSLVLTFTPLTDLVLFTAQFAARGSRSGVSGLFGVFKDDSSYSLDLVGGGTDDELFFLKDGSRAVHYAVPVSVTRGQQVSLYPSWFKSGSRASGSIQVDNVIAVLLMAQEVGAFA